MFVNDQFAEAKSGLVQIQIMRPQNLKKLIDFIYKGQVKTPLILFIYLNSKYM